MLHAKALAALTLVAVKGYSDDNKNYTETAIPDRIGEPCLEACGSGGWCAWCGIRKACCQAGNGAKECVGAEDVAISGYRCAMPTPKALETLRVVNFEFDVTGLFYAAIRAKPQLRKELEDKIKAWVTKLLLFTVQTRFISIQWSLGQTGFSQVSLVVMVPEAGDAGRTLAANRFCGATATAAIRGDAQNLDGLKFGEADTMSHIRLVNRRVNGEPCGEETSKHVERLIQMMKTSQSVWPWVLAGFFTGSCMTCWLVSICNDYCRTRSPKALPRRFPSEGKWQGGPAASPVPGPYREEAPLLQSSAPQQQSQDSARQLVMQGPQGVRMPSVPAQMSGAFQSWNPSAPVSMTMRSQ